MVRYLCVQFIISCELWCVTCVCTSFSVASYGALLVCTIDYLLRVMVRYLCVHQYQLQIMEAPATNV